MCPTVATYGDAAVLPGAIPVRDMTAVTSPGLSLNTTSDAVVLATSAVAAVSAVATYLVTTPPRATGCYICNPRGVIV